MKTFKKIMSFIFNPFQSFGLGTFSDKLIETVSNNRYLMLILSLFISLLVLFIKYFL